MKQVTVRGIPEAIERIIKKEAKEKGVSLNRVLISFVYLWIAASAMQYSLKIVTIDSHYLKLPQIITEYCGA